MNLQLQLFTATSEIQDKFHCCYWDFCTDNETGMVLTLTFKDCALTVDEQKW